MRSIVRSWFLWVGCMSATLSFPASITANVQEISGLSPKATAMGNAFSAVADDFSACYYNPSGLAQQDHHSLSVGYMFVKPYVKQYLLATGEENERDFNRYNSFVLGALVDLTQIVNITGHNFVLGVAATVGDNFKAAWRIHDWAHPVPRFVRLGDEMNRVHIFSGVGLEVLTNMLFVGGGINLWEDLYPKIRVTLGPPTALEVLEKDSDVKGDFEISPIAGALFKPFPWLSLSYTYRGTMKQVIPVDFLSKLKIGSLEIPIGTSIPLNDYYVPWNMTGGIAVRPWKPLLISVDVTFYSWSSYSRPAWRGPVKGWDDTVVPRLGLEYRVWKDLKARAGYYYDPTPVPDQRDVWSNYLDSDKHVLSFGFGIAFTRLPLVGKLPLYYPVEVDGYFQQQFIQDRTQEKVFPGQESWKIEGSASAFGIGMTVGF